MTKIYSHSQGTLSLWRLPTLKHAHLMTRQARRRDFSLRYIFLHTSIFSDQSPGGADRHAHRNISCTYVQLRSAGIVLSLATDHLSSSVGSSLYLPTHPLALGHFLTFYTLTKPPIKVGPFIAGRPSYSPSSLASLCNSLRFKKSRCLYQPEQLQSPCQSR